MTTQMTQINKKGHFPLKEVTYRIIGITMNVHNELGPGFLEAVCEEALIIEFNNNKIDYRNQVPLDITYKNHKLKKKYRADFVIDEKVLMEIKKLNQLSKMNEIQVLNYLKATGLKVGLLLNFGKESLQWKRIVC